ncbi:hypothetical protein [Aeromonas sp. MR16]|uniref:hypothetical protein n=1 Tax=Aeromonas sp. MR16 TaxID=2923420 RepID=UPI001F4A138A|nr:hypothetical protein [Aeromonas sp. MR16]MCH7371714.1 hypothetical protein [Aeromonas sp. MR16]
MELRLIPAAVIFTGSYLPLSMILLSQDFKYEMMGLDFCSEPFGQLEKCAIPFANPALSIGFFLLCLACFIVTIITLRIKTPSQRILIKEVKHIPTDLMNYVLPYVVSFMSIQYSEISKFIGFIVFLFWLFWLSYKSGQIILNPILIALGWKLYEIKYSFVGSPNDLVAKSLGRTEFEPNKFYEIETIQDIIIKKE